MDFLQNYVIFKKKNLKMEKNFKDGFHLKMEKNFKDGFLKDRFFLKIDFFQRWNFFQT